MKNKKTLYQEIEALAKANGGVVTTSLAEKNAIYRASLSYFQKKGVLERSARGVYALQDAWEDEMWLIQNRFKRGIYSGISALYLHHLTDQTPFKHEMTFPATYNTSKVKKESQVSVYQHKMEIYKEGIVNVNTTFGNSVKVYCPEQVLCAILCKRYHGDIQIISSAFKMYVQRSNRNMALLSHFAKLFRVEKQVRSYLEVLL